MKLLVIDGNSIANRSFYGIRLLSTKDGIYTNAVTGFFNIYIKLLKAFSPDYVAVAFDMRAPTFRHKMYDAYKGTRKGMPEELAMQMPYIKQLLTAFGVKILGEDGWEADDIIGTLAHAADKNGVSCVISTGDRDSFQLVTDNVTVNLAATKEDILYTPEKIAEVYGVTPPQMLEIKALMGDNSDNIPGVAGIGEKTALTLIQKYGNVDYIYEHLAELEVTASVRAKLEKGQKMCRLSRELGKISTEAPVSLAMADYRVAGRDEQTLANVLTKLEMFTLLKKLNVTASAKIGTAEKTADKAENTENENPVGIEGTDIMLTSGGLLNCRSGKLLNGAELKEFFESDEPKRTFDVKALWNYCYDNGVELKNVVFDSTLAAYLLDVNASEYTLDNLCADYGIENELPEKSLPLLNDKLCGRVSETGTLGVLSDIEIPLAKVLVSMEHDGIFLDKQGVIDFGKNLEAEIEMLTEQIYDLAGCKFNIASPKQLGQILFEKLELPTNGKKKATGYSTGADVLEGLLTKHPIVPLIMRFRTLTKLNSTYVMALLKLRGEDGRIHTTFKQTETRTGRISSADPNIQNIPVRTPLGREMRRFFVASPGCKLVDGDYSQIELRVLSHLSNDRIMQNAFKNGEDIHTITASQVFNQPPEWVTPEMRTAAKAVNFGIVYGIGAYSLSKDINVSLGEADRYIKQYLSKYSGVNEYMENTVACAKKNGWVATMFGRRRYIPEINAVSKTVQALGRRIAMNTPVQGTAADIIKLAMIRVFDRLQHEKLDARLILQVHDELIVEVNENDAEKAAKILKEEMESAVKLNIPLTADVKIGDTWYDTH